MIILKESRYRVFATATFPGNPVTLHEVDALDDAGSMRQRARLSWSEDNGFFVARGDGPIEARFFSSRKELLLCGHGLLALAQHVAGTLAEGSWPVRTPHGTWTLEVDAAGPAALLPLFGGHRADDERHWIRHALASMELEQRALHALYACPNGVWVAQLDTLEQLQRLDARRVASQRVGSSVPGALIAAVCLPDVCYAFRYFAPWHGKPEDSGTGSAHCYLAPLFLHGQGGNDVHRARQYSPQGSAEMRIALQGERVRLSGAVHAEPLWDRGHAVVALRTPLPREG